jgi:copper chaperone CopZ
VPPQVIIHHLRAAALSRELDVSMVSVEIPIGGMRTGKCVSAIHDALSGLTGVLSTRVTVGSVTVSYDPAVMSPAALRVAINRAGYVAAAA